MNRTPIEWCRTYAADGSFEEGFSVNPVRFRPHGSDRLVTMCQKVSPGCKHCYAEGITRRFWPKDAKRRVAHRFTMGTELVSISFPGYSAEGVSEHSGEFVLDEKTLLSVLKRKAPARVFWGDMTDLFGEWVKDEWLDRMMAVCALTPHLTHLFLTKRPERMRAAVGTAERRMSVWMAMADLPNGLGAGCPEWPLPNVWLGVSAENQAAADARIPLLLQTPAAVRFVSIEPLLWPMDILPYLDRSWPNCDQGFAQGIDMEQGYCGHCGGYETDPIHLRPERVLDWVILGGESGSGPVIRPMHPDWVCSLRDQCVAAGVPFFFKQWGEWIPLADYDPFVHGFKVDKYQHEFTWRAGAKNEAELPLSCFRVGKKAAGRLLDEREWNEMPEVRR